MRILMVGAGAIGGYFGGRLLEIGLDVTFLVRANRKNQLIQNGLVIESGHGNIKTNVKAIVAGEEEVPFDVVILSVKAYHLEQAIEDIKPYVGENTIIIPMLNGYRHFETLKTVFSETQVVGGLCFIGTTLNGKGNIIHSSKTHEFFFGEWKKDQSRLEKIYDQFKKANFNVVLSENIKNDIWNKYIFIATMSGVTTLFRTAIGPILADENGQAICHQLVSEICTILQKFDPHIDPEIAELTMKKLYSVEPTMKASMLRDMEKNGQVEVDHFHGYLLELAEKQELKLEHFPVLRTVYSNLKIYEKS